MQGMWYNIIIIIEMKRDVAKNGRQKIETNPHEN